MSIDELNDLLLSSRPEDWLYNCEREIYTNRNDLNIRIELNQTDKALQSRDFEAEWTIQFANSSAHQRFYDIYYGNSWVETFSLISVDEDRAKLPVPVPITSRLVRKRNYELARAIFDIDKSLDNYMRRAGLSVSDSQAVMATR